MVAKVAQAAVILPYCSGKVCHLPFTTVSTDLVAEGLLPNTDVFSFTVRNRV